jgi:hypothetical protein
MISEFAEIEDKIKRTKLSKEAREKAQHELKKLRQMSPMSAEATVVRNYLDWLLSIPWNVETTSEIQIRSDLIGFRSKYRASFAALPARNITSQVDFRFDPAIS